MSVKHAQEYADDRDRAVQHPAPPRRAVRSAVQLSPLPRYVTAASMP